MPDELRVAEALRLIDDGASFREAARRTGTDDRTLRRRCQNRFEGRDDGGRDGLSHEVIDNEITIIHRDYSHLPALRLYVLGDVHKGAATHQRDRWREWLGYIEKEKDTSLILTGDLLNAALKDSKSDVYEERMTVGVAKRELRAELTPLAGRIDVAVPGNHEDRITRATGDCPIEDLCDFLETPYSPAAALIVYTVGDQRYLTYLRHGTGNTQSLVGLTKGGNVVLADLYLSGHTHRMGHTVDDFYVYEDGELRRMQRHFVNSGSFVGYERYAAQRGYAPARIGAPRIFLDGRGRDIKVSM